MKLTWRKLPAPRQKALITPPDGDGGSRVTSQIKGFYWMPKLAFVVLTLALNQHPRSSNGTNRRRSQLKVWEASKLPGCLNPHTDAFMAVFPDPYRQSTDPPANKGVKDPCPKTDFGSHDENQTVLATQTHTHTCTLTSWGCSHTCQCNTWRPF